MKDLGNIIFEHATGKVRKEYSSYQPKEREDAITQAFFEVIGMPNGYTNKREYKKAIRANEVAVFEIVEEIINGIINDYDAQDALATRFMEERALDLGDSAEFYVESGDELEVVEYAGSNWDIERQRLDINDSFTIKPRNYGISAFEYFERVASGRADWSKLVRMVSEALAKKKKELVHTTLAAQFASISSEPFHYRGTYNEQQILKVVARVEAGNGEKPVLIGTKQALARLQGVVTEKWGNEKNSNGYVSNWMGYDCIELTNALKPNSTELQLSDSEIYVVSGAEKFIKVVTEGAELSRERTHDNMADQSQELTVSVKIGIATVFASYVGRIELQ